MTACDRWRAELKALADGELGLWSRLGIALHLARCASCREEVAEMETVSEALRDDNQTGMSEDLRERLLAAASNTRLDGEPVTAWAPPVWRRPTVWVGAAAAALAWAILFPIFSQSREMARVLPKMAAREAPGPSASVAMPGAGWAADATAERQVRRSASISVAVQDLEARNDEVERMTRKVGGFVANSALSTGADGLRSSTVTIRVPVGDFDSVLSRIAKLGMVTSKNVTGEDVTERVSDEEQAVRVLNEEIRAADGQLRQPNGGWHGLDDARRLRISKAQAEARLALLKKQARLATIEVQLSERARTQIQGGWIEDIRDAGRAALNGFLAAVRVPVLVVIWVLAYAPIWIPLVVAYRWAARRQREWADARRMQEWSKQRYADGG